MFKFAGKVLSLCAASLMVTTAIASAETLAEIEAAAKKEGMFSPIALPHDWCGWEGILNGFKAKYRLSATYRARVVRLGYGTGQDALPVAASRFSFADGDVALEPAQ